MSRLADLEANLSLLHEKLAHLEHAEIITANASEGFELRCKIEEIRRKIAEVEAEKSGLSGEAKTGASAGAPGTQNAAVNAPTGQAFIIQHVHGNVIAGGAQERQPPGTPARPTPSAKRATGAHRYDAFISYRRQEPDKAFARKLLQDLEARGYRVAIDERDFAANQPFVAEMERCVKESRFTLAVVSPRYFESGNCEEEAVICKVLDMSERRRRLVPLVLEAVGMPTWMYGITGVRFDDPDPLVPPLERVVETLGSETLGNPS
jgi:hypothetical protein